MNFDDHGRVADDDYNPEYLTASGPHTDCRGCTHVVADRKHHLVGLESDVFDFLFGRHQSPNYDDRNSFGVRNSVVYRNRIDNVKINKTMQYLSDPGALLY